MSRTGTTLCLGMALYLILALGTSQVSARNDLPTGVGPKTSSGKTVRMVPWVMEVDVASQISKQVRVRNKTVTQTERKSEKNSGYGILLLKGDRDISLGLMNVGDAKALFVNQAKEKVGQNNATAMVNGQCKEWLITSGMGEQTAKNIANKLVKALLDYKAKPGTYEIFSDWKKHLTGLSLSNIDLFDLPGEKNWVFHVEDKYPQDVLVKYFPQSILRERVRATYKEALIGELNREITKKKDTINDLATKLESLKKQTYPSNFTFLLGAAFGLNSSPAGLGWNLFGLIACGALVGGALLYGLFKLIGKLLGGGGDEEGQEPHGQKQKVDPGYPNIVLTTLDILRDKLNRQRYARTTRNAWVDAYDFINDLPGAVDDLVAEHRSSLQACLNTKKTLEAQLKNAEGAIQTEAESWNLRVPSDFAGGLSALLNYVLKIRKQQQALEPHLAVLAGVPSAEEKSSLNPNPAPYPSPTPPNMPTTVGTQAGWQQSIPANSGGGNASAPGGNLPLNPTGQAAQKPRLGNINSRLLTLLNRVQEGLRKCSGKRQGLVKGEVSLAHLVSQLEHMEKRADILERYMQTLPGEMKWQWSDSDDRLHESLKAIQQRVNSDQPLWYDLNKAPGPDSPWEKLGQYLELRRHASLALGLGEGAQCEEVSHALDSLSPVKPLLASAPTSTVNPEDQLREFLTLRQKAADTVGLGPDARCGEIGDAMSALSAVQSLLRKAPTETANAEDQLREYLDLRENMARHLQKPSTSTCPDLIDHIKEMKLSLFEVSRSLELPEVDHDEQRESLSGNSVSDSIITEKITFNQALVEVAEKAKNLKAKATHWARKVSEGEALLALFSNRTENNESSLRAAHRILDEIDKARAELSNFHLVGNGLADWARELYAQWEKARKGLVVEMRLGAGTSLPNACQAAQEYFHVAENARLKVCEALALGNGVGFPEVSAPPPPPPPPMWSNKSRNGTRPGTSCTPWSRMPCLICPPTHRSLRWREVLRRCPWY